MEMIVVHSFGIEIPAVAYSTATAIFVKKNARRPYSAGIGSTNVMRPTATGPVLDRP